MPPEEAMTTTATAAADVRMRIERLHLVTPAHTGPDVTRALRAALDAGARHVQARTKAVSDRERLAFTSTVRRICADAGATLVVNDRADVALAAGAAGVHVGDEDLPPAVVRRLLGPDAIVGVTCRDPEAARRAADAGADYLGVGPAYATTTKAGLPAALGPSGIEAVARAVDLPVIAIAGVTPARVPELLAAGAHGVAVVSAVFGAADPTAATRTFLEALPCR
jgi:thiamine-phosphate pyrophosphorylase